MTELQKQAKELESELCEMVLNERLNVTFNGREAIRHAAAILRRIERGELREVDEYTCSGCPSQDKFTHEHPCHSCQDNPKYQHYGRRKSNENG